MSRSFVIPLTPAIRLAPSRPSSFFPSFKDKSSCSHEPHSHTDGQKGNNPSTHPQPHFLASTGALGRRRGGGGVGCSGSVGGLHDGDVGDCLDVAVGVGGGADAGAGDEGGGVGEGVGWVGGGGGDGWDAGGCDVGHGCG